MAQTTSIGTGEFPDLWGLTANEVAKRNSTARLSLHEYHIDLDTDAANEVRSLESVASYPLQLMLENQAPFNYSIEGGHETPAAFIPVFSNAVKLYQLYIFFVYTISELGSVHADKILEIQSTHIKEWMDSGQAYALTARFDDISEAATQHTRQHVINAAHDPLDIPIEHSIAKVFLLQNKESPLFDADNLNTNSDDMNFRGMDLALADHLGLAKDRALEVYANYFNIVIVEV